jgi:hypothetical protein
MPDTTTRRTDDAYIVADVLREFTDGAPSEYAAAMERVASRLTPDLDAATALRRSADEEPGPSIHLPGSIADALLVARGWTIERLPQRTARKSNTGGMVAEVVEERCYVLPGGTPRAQGGKFGTDYLWERDDALGLALVAEGLAS